MISRLDVVTLRPAMRSTVRTVEHHLLRNALRSARRHGQQRTRARPLPHHRRSHGKQGTRIPTSKTMNAPRPRFPGRSNNSKHPQARKGS